MIPTLDPVSIPSPEMTLAAAVGVGLAASLNVCAAVRLPVVAVYVAGAGISRKRALILSALFTLGLIAGTILLGLMAAPGTDGVHQTVQVNKHLFWILGVGLVITGALLSGLLNPQLLPERWRAIGTRLVRPEVCSALLLGFALGLLQTPACPTCRAELTAVIGAGGSRSFLLLAGFAVGQCFLALGVGALMGLLKPTLFGWLRTQMCSVELRAQLLAGNVLIVLGLYFAIVG